MLIAVRSLIHPELAQSVRNDFDLKVDCKQFKKYNLIIRILKSMKKMLLYLIIAVITVNCCSYLIAATNIKDSSSITTATLNPVSLIGGYILYQSRINNQPTVHYIHLYTYSVFKTCPTGWYACGSTQLINYDDVNPSQCYLNNPLTQTGIALQPAGYIVNIWFGIKTSTKSSSSCYDRGGNYTYIVSCFPPGNVDSSTTTTSVTDPDGNNLGNVCVVQSP